MNKSLSTSKNFKYVATSAANTSVSVPSSSYYAKSNLPKSTENAVYNYIKAVRSLGRNAVTVSEVANALSLSRPTVMMAMDILSSKGVKKIK